MPEGVYSIVEAPLYLATASKSNSANDYFKAFAMIEAEGKVQVPKHLKDGNCDARDLGDGQRIGRVVAKLWLLGGGDQRVQFVWPLG